MLQIILRLKNKKYYANFWQLLSVNMLLSINVNYKIAVDNHKY